MKTSKSCMDPLQFVYCTNREFAVTHEPSSSSSSAFNTLSVGRQTFQLLQPIQQQWLHPTRCCCVLGQDSLPTLPLVNVYERVGPFGTLAASLLSVWMNNGFCKALWVLRKVLYKSKPLLLLHGNPVDDGGHRLRTQTVLDSKRQIQSNAPLSAFRPTTRSSWPISNEFLWWLLFTAECW